jgi:sugar lactone lactonase YvrE
MVQNRTPAGPDPLTVSDDEIQLPAGDIVLGQDVYAHDASGMDGRSDGDALISTDPVEADIGPGELLYIVADSDRDIYQFYPESPYSLSSPSEEGDLDISSEDNYPEGMAFNGDGSKVYLVGDRNNNIYEYDCSTPYNVTTASLSFTFDVSDEDTAPKGMAWNNDGSKLYMTGRNDEVYEYDCSTPYDTSTASLSASLDVSNDVSVPNGMEWNNDGSKLYVVGRSNSDVYEYDLTTPFDVTTASYAAELNVFSQEADPKGMAWNADGSKLYIVGDDSDNVVQYGLTTPFDVTTASLNTEVDLNPPISDMVGVTWSG